MANELSEHSNETASLSCLDGWQYAASSAERLLHFLARIPRRRQCKHFVETARRVDASARSHESILVLASTGLYTLPFAMNLVRSFTQHWPVQAAHRTSVALPHVGTDLLMVATDPGVCGGFPSLQQQATCLEMRRWVEETSGPAAGYGSKTYTNASKFPPVLVAATLSLNITLVYTDIDIVWFRNPIPLLSSLLTGGHRGTASVDLVTAMDVPNPQRHWWENKTYSTTACGHFLSGSTGGVRGDLSGQAHEGLPPAGRGVRPAHLWFGLGFYAVRPSAASLGWYARWAAASVRWQSLTVEKTACIAAIGGEDGHQGKGSATATSSSSLSSSSLTASVSSSSSSSSSASPPSSSVAESAPPWSPPMEPPHPWPSATWTPLTFAFLDPIGFECGLAFAPTINVRKGWQFRPVLAYMAHFNWVSGEKEKVCARRAHAMWWHSRFPYASQCDPGGVLDDLPYSLIRI